MMIRVVKTKGSSYSGYAFESYTEDNFITIDSIDGGRYWDEDQEANSQSLMLTNWWIRLL